MKKLLIILLLTLLLVSCELDTNTAKGDIYLVSVALDYTGTNLSKLPGAINDQDAIIKQLKYLSKLENRQLNSYAIKQCSTLVKKKDY